MANETKKTNMIVPEVMGDMIEAKIDALCKLTPYAAVDNSLEGVPGDTKTVPCWNYIGDAEDVAEGVEVGLTQMTASSTTFTIKKAMKAVGITEEARLSGLGDPIGQAETQLAKSIVSKVDNDLVDTAYTSNNVFDGTAAVIGYDNIVDAVTKFEDEEDGIEKVMFIHPKQEATLLKDDDFHNASTFNGDVAVKGAIGKIAGCWVKKSKKVQKVDAQQAVAGVYTLTITGSGAAGDKVYINDAPVELSEDSAKTATAIATAIATAFASNDYYTISRSGAVLTLTEKSGKEGTTTPSAHSDSDTIDITVGVTTAGKEASEAHYKCPIIKMEPDSAETEYTEDELPALTIYLKKNTTVTSAFKHLKQLTELVACKFYGVALTNATKVVIAKFKA